MFVIIKECSVAEIENQPNFPHLLEEYEKEMPVKDGPPMRARMDLYRQIESSGCFKVWGAFCEEKLVGLITALVTVLPHWGVLFGVSESYFCLSDYRKNGTGLRLLGTAESYVRERGSDYFLVSAPIDGDLAEVLPHRGYAPTSIVFLKRLNHVE